MENEIWKDVLGFEGLYQASNLGNIRRIDAVVSRETNGKVYTFLRKGRVLRQHTQRTGYQSVGLCKNGLAVTKSVHRLVCEAFHGPAPEDHEVGHLNGNRTENRADNLAWVTKFENQAHRIAHGTSNRGEGAYQAVLTEEAVRAIRAARSNGVGLAPLASRYGVTAAAISSAARGKSWRHI